MDWRGPDREPRAEASSWPPAGTGAPASASAGAGAPTLAYRCADETEVDWRGPDREPRVEASSWRPAGTGAPASASAGAGARASARASASVRPLPYQQCDVCEGFLFLLKAEKPGDTHTSALCVNCWIRGSLQASE